VNFKATIERCIGIASLGALPENASLKRRRDEGAADLKND
jgi:hypothetical protein